MAADPDKTLHSLTVHYSLDDYIKFDKECKAQKTPKVALGQTFLDVYPAATIHALEMQGDEVDLPSALALNLITKGQFASGKNLIAVQQSPPLRIRFKNGTCLKIHLLFNPADGSLACARHDDNGDILTIPAQYQTTYGQATIKVGMTRADVQKHCGIDGGISAPFRYERFVVAEQSPRKDGLRTKINVRFRPAGMSDAVYYLGKWQNPKLSDADTVVAASAPYLELPFYD